MHGYVYVSHVCVCQKHFLLSPVLVWNELKLWILLLFAEVFLCLNQPCINTTTVQTLWTPSMEDPDTRELVAIGSFWTESLP